MKSISDSLWLTPWERDAVISGLLEFDLIKHDNNRNLPLKSGGTTDIYISLRDARNTPAAIEFLAQQYVNPLIRLRADRFVEVPDSVSCFAGPLSIKTNLPYITIREQEKRGRVAGAKFIGSFQKGERVPFIDDVITDGGSKIVPYQECEKRKINADVCVVLVDRQQGWWSNLEDAGIHFMDVWAGMTLHHVRRTLIERDIMKRCDSELEKKNPIIVSLDGKNWDEVLPLIDELRTTGCIFKVNDLLFAKGTESLIPDLSVYGRVMADLKGHDIPNTLENIAARLKKNPPWAVTIHGSGGRKMIKSTVDKLKGTGVKILVVTVLTSIDPVTCKEIYRRRPISQVKKLAEMASSVGVDGFVCSPQEVAMLRNKYPKSVLVIPGIRSAEKDADDQERIGTPRGTMNKGASHLVMGRQILNAPDPVAEVKRLLSEELQVI